MPGFSPDEPGVWYAVLPLEKVYTFNPVVVSPVPVRCKSSSSLDSSSKKSSEAEVTDDKDSAGQPNGVEEVSTTESKVAKEEKEDTGKNKQNGLQSQTLTADEKKLIIGGQANLWTECINDEDTAEYMLLPRLCAFSECVWSPSEAKDWHNFRERLQGHVTLLDMMGYKFRPLS